MKKKRLLSVLVSLALLLSLLPTTVLAAAEEEENINYVDAVYNENTGKVEYSQKTVSDYTVVTNQTAWGETGKETWYVVNADVEITSRITVTGDVHLILADGAKLTASKGIGVNSGSSLTIYGQTNGTGELKATANTTDVAGISGSNITINGGTVTAKGGRYGAGIGGGTGGIGSNITISGGTVNATGGVRGAGIGGGNNGSGSYITITGGTVTATGGEYAAGIGGGYGGSGSNITITGGTVTAKGGRSAAGIGGGYDNNHHGSGSNIKITGGTVTAWSATATANGIGGGNGSNSSNITYEGDAFVVIGYLKYDIPTTSSGVIIVNNNGQVYGSPTLTTDATVPEEATLTVPDNTILTVSNGTTLTNNGTITIKSGGTITNNGTIINNGTINGTVTGNQPGVYVKYQAYNTEEGKFSEATAFATPVTSQTSLGAGWYVVQDTVTITSCITVSGDVHLILVDGAKLTAGSGIYVPEGTDTVNSLTIYGQTNGTGTLIANGATCAAGIGGVGTVTSESVVPNSGPITIHGGVVTATGGNYGAGIGGGYRGSGENITIYGGEVTANGGFDGAGIGGAGIGGGTGGIGSNITISGGTVNATGGVRGAGIGGGCIGSSRNITISGGTVTAKGGLCGAGIGSGYDYGSGSVSVSDIQITGGFVIAQGGAAYYNQLAGAAIGSGSYLYYPWEDPDYDPSSGPVDSYEVYVEGEELDISSENCVVLKQRGSESEMTGQVYGEAELDTNAEVPSNAILTVPEGTSLTIASGTTLINSGTIYVDSTLNYGETKYGTLTGTDNVYYRLTVKGGSAESGTTTYDSKTYAKESAGVTLTAEDKVGLAFNGEWTTSLDTLTVTDNQFSMPAQPLTVTAGDYTNAPTYTVTIPESVEIGGTVTVKAEKVNVAEGYDLNVSIDDDNSFDLTLEDHNDETLSYVVHSGTVEGAEVEAGSAFLTVAGNITDNSGSCGLAFTLADGQKEKYTGKYTGKVTFTVSVAEATAN